MKFRETMYRNIQSQSIFFSGVKLTTPDKISFYDGFSVIKLYPG